MQNIEGLIKTLEARDDGGSAKRFVRAFGLYVRGYLEYKRWMAEMVEKNDQYRGARTEEECHNLCLGDIILIQSIQKNGLSKPIGLFSDCAGTEIDGYHRLVILKELGIEEIPCTS